MSEIKAIIFDCDGTLLDTERIYMGTWSTVAKEMGYDIPQEVLTDTRGKSGAYIRQRFYGALGDDFPFEEIDKIRMPLNEKIFYEREDVVKPGVEILLRWCKENNIKLAVASAKHIQITSDHLKHGKIYEQFDAVLGGNMVTKNKPEPDLFLKAAQILGVPSENCIVMGDASADMKAAKAAGMKAFFIPDLVPVDEEIESVAEKILNRIDEVIPYIK